jgi:hypothetical protein
MEVVQEFDLYIKPAKLVKGKGLCKLVVEAQDQVNEEPGWENDLMLWCSETLYVSPGQESWYGKLTYLLHHGTCLEYLNPKERIVLKVKSRQYHLINLMLFHVNYDVVLLICIEHEDAKKVPKELHDGPAGGHFVGDTTAHNILRVIYYCPTLFRDAHTHARNCKTCQMSIGRETIAVVPLQPVDVSRTVKKCGLYVIGEITPSYSKQHNYILTATDYFTKWAEVVPLTHVNENMVIQFIEQKLITRFGMPSIFFFDNAT